MRITYDPAKRLRTLVERGLDFEDAGVVFRDATVEIEDTRKDYGEVRMICYGRLAGGLIVVGYVPRSTSGHVFSMGMQMTARKSASSRILKSDLKRVDAHVCDTAATIAASRLRCAPLRT